MLFSSEEYVLNDKPVNEMMLTIVQEFLGKNEKVSHTFDGDNIFAFFTNRKIIFVCSDFYETEIMPYSSIESFVVLGTPNTVRGRFKITLSDGIDISFCLPKYNDAVKLCNQLISYI